MIRTAVDGNLRTITLDRPERRNALTESGLEDLKTTLEDATEPVVYLHGAGDAFCAGADLDIVAGLADDREPVDGDDDPGDESEQRGAARAFVRRGQEIATLLATYDGAVVAGIDGAARGGGVELALACDVRVATPDATLSETGVTLGLFGAWGGTVRLPEVVGQGEAMDVALSGRVIDATDARRMGLVSRIVEDPRTVATDVATNDPAAVRTIKARLRDDGGRDTQEDREVAAFARLVEDFDPENRNG
ncbi:MAG: enoyl-CoA hydratase [Haloarculaceae archaeon]|jgi:enoyl-CoA hydratase